MKSALLAVYLDEVRRRLRLRLISRLALLLILGGSLITAIFAVLFVALVPDPGVVDIVRMVLLLFIVVVVTAMLFWQYSDPKTVNIIERLAPAFAGSLETWRDTIARNNTTPVSMLLQHQVERRADDHPATSIVPLPGIVVPGIAALLLLLVTVVAIFLGSNPWQLSAQRLWTGDAFSDTAPRIVVAPGDIVIPHGSDVVIDASATGFVPRNLTMNASFERTAAWERAPMSRTADDAFSFVFVGVMEEVAYYVGSGSVDAAGEVNSDRYMIRVAELPRITDVKLSYQFPEWTGLPVADQETGDLWALPDTHVDVHATSDLNLEAGILVINGVETPAAVSGSELQGSFRVDKPGSWHIAVRHEGILTRISDTYLIHLVDDRAPEIAFEWPGHDRRVSAIEEVALRFRATDDYAVESLSVHYSVNGGQWETLGERQEDNPGQTGQEANKDQVAEHVLYLEELLADGEAAEPGTSTNPLAVKRGLRPGDIVSIYGETSDHTQRVRSSLYFVDVRPFDQMYRESQQSGGGGGGGQDTESSQRQREIVTATWNLINRRQDGSATQADVDQSAVLSVLQRTLKDQVQTLIDRADARRLDADESIGALMRELNEAVLDMEPAAVELERDALEAAITPAQQALQHLLAAEATMRDVDVTRSEGGGGGSSSGRSLDELVELELDPERNRYEMPQEASDSQQREQEDIWQKLEELAARQELLAENRREAEERLPSRWQQEQLRREIEELRERIAQQQQRSQQQGSQNAQQQGGEQQSQGARSGTPGQSAQSQSSQPLAEALVQVDRALESIDRSMDQQSQGQGETDVRGAMDRASQALAQSARQLKEAEVGNLEQRLESSSRKISELLETQRSGVQRLEELGSQVREQQTKGERVFYYDYSMEPFAAQKRRMLSELAEVTGDIARIAASVDRQSAAAGRSLDRALDQLAQDQVEERLAYTADLFSVGRPLLAGTQEALVERALQRLNDNLELARGYLSDATAAGDPLDELRQIRRDLARATATGAGGDASAIARRLDRVQSQLSQQIGQPLDVDTALDRELYIARGTDDANSEVLLRMTADRLDLIENALMRSDAEPVRAQIPRDRARDSAAADRYFRALSHTDESLEARNPR